MERHPKILETLKYQTLPARKDPYFEGISIHHSLLYKHQTSSFLRYAKTLYLSHYKVHRDFSFTNLTFGGFSSGTTPMPSIWSLCCYSQVPIGVTWSLQLTDDFSTSSIGAVCGRVL